MKNCGTCRFFFIDPADGFLSCMGNDTGVCTWKPSAKDVAISWFSATGSDPDLPGKRYMRKLDGHNCPVYKPSIGEETADMIDACQGKNSDPSSFCRVFDKGSY